MPAATPIIAVLLVLFCTVQGFAVDYQEDFLPVDQDADSASLSMAKRDWTSSSCRRCMYRRDDWRSCVTCFNRPGASIPFYGGFTKRSFPETFAPGELDIYQGEGGYPEFTAEKRGFQDPCRCCMASYTNTQCCARCHMTPYYGSFGKRSTPGKRSYDTSFVPLSMTGAGMCDLCCSPDTFDYYCCAFSCSERKRK